MKSVYVAASAIELPRAKHAVSMLEAAGIRVTSTWIASIEAAGASNPRDASAEQRRAWSVADFAELRDADVLWFLAPSASAPTRGAWAELGFAAALGKRIVSSGDTRQSIFCAIGDEHESDDEALAAIVALAARRHVGAVPVRVDEIEAAKHRLRTGPFRARYPEDDAGLNNGALEHVTETGEP